MRYKVLFALLIFSSNVMSSDLDDGIGMESISSGDSLSLKKNIQFSKRKAKATRYNASSGKKSSRSWVCGSGNIYIEKGSRVREVTNLSDNRGTVAICSK